MITQMNPIASGIAADLNQRYGPASPFYFYLSDTHSVTCIIKIGTKHRSVRMIQVVDTRLVVTHMEQSGDSNEWGGEMSWFDIYDPLCFDKCYDRVSKILMSY